MNNNININENNTVLANTIDENRSVNVSPSKNDVRLATYSNSHHFNVDTGNKSLDTITNNILACNEIGENMLYLVAVNIAYVKENKDFLNGTHFKNLEQYALEMFGYKKAWTYKLANITKFINVKKRIRKADDSIDLIEFNPFESFDINDLQISVLSDIDGFRFSVGKLDILAKCNEEQIKSLIETEIIDSTSSEKDIHRAVNSVLGIEDKSKSKSSENDSENDSKSSENDSENIKPKSYKLITDIDRYNAILDIIKDMENKQNQNTIKRAIEKCKNGKSDVQ